jgi:hypothetical protein
MKSLLLPLAFCAALGGCVAVPYDPYYNANAYPYGTPTGVVQPAYVYSYPYPYAYGYSYPYYGSYWYPSIYISGTYSRHWHSGHRWDGGRRWRR